MTPYVTYIPILFVRFVSSKKLFSNFLHINVKEAADSELGFG